ncbi:suppressor of glycerol defect [Coemansia sp. RSA 552]|nr:suppressor of glycerol defect [Coemansia sp. RSA 552]
MPPIRRIQANAMLPAALSSKISGGAADEDKRYTKRAKNGAKARKVARKQAREEKKQRKNASHKNRHGFAVESNAKANPQPEKPTRRPEAPKSRPKAPKPATKDDRSQLVKFAQRNQGMYNLLRESNLIENVDKEAGVASKASAAEDLEDREMRRLERNLGIKTGAKLGNAFFEEGLGDVLKGIDVGSSNVRKAEDKPAAPQRPATEVDTAGSSSESGSDLEEAGMDIDGEDDDDGDNDDDDDDMFGLNGLDGGDSGSESEDSDVAEMYRSVKRYIPPSLRRKLAEGADEDERVAAIRKTLQGQLNRLSESNIEGIVLQIEEQYQKYPRHHVTEVLTSLILQAIQSRIHMLDTFLYVNAAIVGAVYRAVGLEPVAHLVQNLMEEFERRFKQSMAEFRSNQGAMEDDDDDGSRDLTIGKECQNLCVFVAELYNFQVISCHLVYDVIRLCVEEINEFTAELLLKLIRISGQQLRKDDPLALKEIVRQVSGTLDKGAALSVRCKFMVESLTSLKDNRMRNAMSQNADNVARLKRFLGNMDKRRTVNAAEPINIGLQDIRDIETKGKWWLVGSSWVGSQYSGGAEAEAPAAQQAMRRAKEQNGSAEMDRLLQMAQQQHMNTDIRRSIFVTLLSSEDYAEAFERLLKLDLKKTQTRETVRVVLHCCGQEKAYNPYYTLVAYKLCAFHTSYQVTMQYALWDFLRELGEADVGGLGRITEDDPGAGADVPLRRIVNLAKMYAWLVDKQVLSLLILKTVTFARVGVQARVFFQVMFTTLFLLHKKRSEKDLRSVFSTFQRAASNPTMCHGMLFFFHHFVKACELVPADDLPVVRWGCRVAKQAIRSSASDGP